jgi:hypothetical protein
MSSWIKITSKSLKEVDNHKCLVTNNIGETNSFGDMSHVWLTDAIYRDKKNKQYYCIDDLYLRIHGITHYCLIPKP